MRTKILASLAATSLLLLVSCGIDDDPIAPGTEPVDLLVTLTVQPPTSLRTIDTWSSWSMPVSAVFMVASGVAEDGHGGHSGKVGLLRKSEEGHGDALEGSIELNGMAMTMRVENPTTMFEPQHGGGMLEHHAGVEEHHVSLQLVETATGHHGHGGATVSHCEVHLVATNQGGQAFEVELLPVQGGHGFRYEANAAIPEDIYDLRVEVEPPHFFRDEHTMGKWTTDIAAEFSDVALDNSFTGGSIGEVLWTGAGGDSLLVGLRAGGVRTYGAVGIGAIPLAGDENINFSVHLEDPTLAAHSEPLFEASVLVTISNQSNGTSVIGHLEPMYSEHGFHFAQNWNLGIGHVDGGEGGGHDHKK